MEIIRISRPCGISTTKALDPKVRKDLIGRIQKLMYERTMVIPTIRSAVPYSHRTQGKGQSIQDERRISLMVSLLPSKIMS